MHNGCILCGGVGVGKSHTAVGYYLQNEAPRKVYVITTAKKRDKFDWQELFAQVGMIENPELTMGATVKVDSWENIKKYEEVTDAFFIFDEQRLVGTGRWVKAFYKIAAANRWIMLSATPGDNWLDYVPVFRANGFIKNITQFKEDHVVSRWTGRYYQVTGYRQVPKLVRWRNSLLVDMPYEKHTTRHTHYVAVDYDKDLVKELVNKRWHVYENRPLTDASELFRVMRKVVYSHDSRLQAVRGLLKTHPKLIVFYNFDYELEMLRKLGKPSGKATSLSEMNSDTTSESSSRIVDDALRGSDGIVHLDPTTPSNLEFSGNTRTSKPESITQRSTSSLNPSETEATLSTSDLSTNSSDPWDYLLSPEGMRENSTPTTRDGSSPKRMSHGSSEPCPDSTTTPETDSVYGSGSTDSDSSARTLRTNILLSTGTGSPTSTSLVPTGSSEPTRQNRSTSSSSTDTAGSISTSTTRSTDPTAPSAGSTDLSRKWATSTESLRTLRTNSPSEISTTLPISDEVSSAPTRESEETASSTGTLRTAMSPPTTLKESGSLDLSTSSSESIGTKSQSAAQSRRRLSVTSSLPSLENRQDAENSESSRNTSEPSLDQRHSSSIRQSSTTASATTTTEPGSTGGTDSLEGSDTCQTSTGESSAAQTDLISSPDGRKTKNGSTSLEGSAKTTTQKESSRASSRSQGRSVPGRSSGCEPSFQVAEWNGHKHEEVPTTTSWVYLVQYVAGAEAWECVETDAMVFYSMPYSYKLWWQAHGRIDRLHTSFLDLHYYILFGDSILERAVKKSLSMKKSFNESALGRSLGLS